MKKRIVLEVKPQIRLYDDVFHVQIIKQTHRGSRFGNPNTMFRSSTGLLLDSRSCPEIYMTDNIYYVRGSNHGDDSIVVVVRSIDDMQRIMHAVREYNSHVILGELPSIPAGSGPFTID